MKLQFKHQEFQAEAVRATCDIFAGQPLSNPFRYILDPGKEAQRSFEQNAFANSPLIISKEDIWRNIHQKQVLLGLKPSGNPKNPISLTIEMETGTGKTYTYIKTMYELNKLYGWSKFIIVVPSVAIREGVKKSFEITKEHFKQEYNKSIEEFIYNSSRLNTIETFATDNKIRVMIINSQAFASSLKEDGRSKESRIIFTEQDKFKGRKPIDVIAKTNPILILDEPQSLGKTLDTATQKGLQKFNALFTLAYSATPPDLNKNIVYRLDAIDAYNKKLVKKIAVKGVTIAGNTANNGYLYLAYINTFVGKNPTAKIEIDFKGTTGIKKKTITVNEGDNLYDLSGHLDEYKNYLITRIDASTESINLQNGITVSSGDVIGHVNENQLRRIQIRETIISHFEREKALFNSGIKVLSLFFIDEVAKYRASDKSSEENGMYAQMFEEEYNRVKEEKLLELNDNQDYIKFLKESDASTAHQGYFSIDKKSGTFKNSEIKRGATSADDIDAYDLIMKNKERLLDKAESVRFLFSHSALREGWDNPNVFQICTLKNSANDDKRRQEIGRGLRLSVNQHGERMDESILGSDVQNINLLTVIANESYEDFVSKLQKDMEETLTDRPREVSESLFVNKSTGDRKITKEEATAIYEDLIVNGYVRQKQLTEKYHEDVAKNAFQNSSPIQSSDIIAILETIYKPIKIDNARESKITPMLSKEKLNKKEFQDLWKKINIKSSYNVSFDSEELVKKSIEQLNTHLKVSTLTATINTGEMDEITRKDLEERTGFKQIKNRTISLNIGELSSVKYDLLDKLVQETALTRLTIANILQGIHVSQFNLFKQNPEEFIIRTANIINEQKATAIVEHIAYNKLDDTFNIDIFTDPKFNKGTKENTIETPHKHIYSHVVADSNSRPERDMAENLDVSDEVAVYAKLPRGFYISTPVGKYNPDWAIAFNEGQVKHIYFIAETKGSMDSLSLELRGLEQAKIDCARKHFQAISNDEVKYHIVDSYAGLMSVLKG